MKNIFFKKKKKQTQALNIIKIKRKTKSGPALTFNHITKKDVTKVIKKLRCLKTITRR